MGIPHIGLEAGGVYHIYNHAVGSDNIFKQDENYIFFLRKFSARITPFAEVFAFCLMPNHFHFVLRIKDKKEIVKLWSEKLKRVKAKRERKNSKETADHILIDEIIVTEFGSLFNSYVQAFNKKYNRRGSLLKESFQRKIVDGDLGLIKLICYVHNNPVEHGFTSRREEWKYSSYNAILSEAKTSVLREEVVKLFGGKHNLIYLHDQNKGNEL